MDGADRRAEANARAFEALVAAEPTLVDVRPAGEVVPGMTPQTVLTSGAPLPWDEYVGGQRRAIIGGALFEGLAETPEEVDERIRAGEIIVSTCHEHDCVGSVAGIYTASMPVFVVENRTVGNRAFCNFYEGPSRFRLNYGVYNEEVRDNLRMIAERIAPVIAEALRIGGPIPLKPLMRRAIHMGDELHSRNTAATLLFTRELFPALLDVAGSRAEEVRHLLEFLKESDYFFLRLSMAASKVTANAAHGIPGSSVVTAMTLSCRDFAIRVSGLGEQWFRGPHPVVEAKLFEGFTPDDIEWIGGESHHAETVGLGGFVQAAAFALQEYQGGSADAMVEMNLSMYRITVGEHPDFRIPYLGYRGAPTGIDVFRVVETGVTPVIDGGLAGKDGGQIGAGILRAPMACFEAAVAAYIAAYPAEVSAGS
jgi:hypothetical protein